MGCAVIYQGPGSEYSMPPRHTFDRKRYICSVENIWGNDCYIHCIRSNARGVAILLNDNFEY